MRGFTRDKLDEQMHKILQEERVGLSEAAAEGNYVRICELTRGWTSAVETKDNLQETPLHLACRSGQVEVVRHLVQLGSDVNAVNTLAMTPLEVAAGSGHREVVSFLLENGADVNKQDRCGWTCMHRAAKNGHVDVVVDIVEKGGPIDHGDITGQTPAHWAAEYGHSDVVEALGISRADLNIQDDDGETPLHKASRQGQAFTVAALLSLRVYDNITNTDGQTPFDVSATAEVRDILRPDSSFRKSLLRRPEAETRTEKEKAMEEARVQMVDERLSQSEPADAKSEQSLHDSPDAASQTGSQSQTQEKAGKWGLLRKMFSKSKIEVPEREPTPSQIFLENRNVSPSPKRSPSPFGLDISELQRPQLSPRVNLGLHH